MIKILRFLLFPFGLVFLLITETRNFLYKVKILRSTSFSLPVISIGNLSTGGTGKTPTSEYIIRILLSENKKTGFLSRGYGRKTLGFRWVNADAKTKECGDEPLQIKTKFSNVKVAVGEKRVDGILQMMREKNKIEAIVLDDAFQHRALQPSFSILTTTFFDAFFSDFILPVGNLRELRKNAERADVVLITKCPEGILENEYDYYKQLAFRYSKAPVFFSRIKYGKVISLFSNEEMTNDYQNKNILLVTGIAKPEEILSHLSNVKALKHLHFGDHHEFTAKDIEKITQIFNSFATENKIILTTEKDAVRMKSLSDSEKNKLKSLPVYFLEIENEILRDEKEKFDNIILEHVRTFK